MKGPIGLVIAGILGLLGIALNWFYLEQKTKGLEMTTFLGVRPGVSIEIGDSFQQSHFQRVNIPKLHAGNLPEYVYTWNDLATVVGTKATRNYFGGELMLKEDYRTPQLTIDLKEDERLIPINVGDRSPLVQPGDEISFWIPSAGPGSNQGELIGPFLIGAIGNQVGSADVMRAYGIPHLQANQLGIIVKVEGNQFEQRARTLLEKIAAADGRSLKVVSHPRPKS